MGFAYSAVELATGENVAIKKAPTDGYNNNRVRREADVMHRLSDCPSSIQLRGFYDDEEDVDKSEEGGIFSYIAMEYCGGGDLGRVMKVRSFEMLLCIRSRFSLDIMEESVCIKRDSSCKFAHRIYYK